MKIQFRTVFWIAAAVIVAGMLALAFRPQPVPVDMTQATVGPLVVAVRDEGRTRVRNEYVVSAPVSGQLLRVPFKPGAEVSAGETVARILPADPSFLDVRSRAEAEAILRSAEAALAVADADLERAQAQRNYAVTEVERLTRLREQGLIAQDALDRAQLQLRVAEADLETVRESVRMRRAEVEAARARLVQPGDNAMAEAVVAVPAPISGRVLRVVRESATVIASGADILSIGDPSDLEIVAELLSTDAVQVEPGARVMIENWGGGGSETLNGRVRLVEPFGFTKISALGVEEQRVNVIVDFTDPREKWESLGHGYRVEVAIVVWEDEDVLHVPVSALFRRGTQWAVYRVVDGAAVLTPVEVGHDNGINAEVLDGLDAGATIILYPGEQIEDGTPVEQRGV